MLAKLESLLFYPILFLASYLVYQSWDRSPRWVSLTLAVTVGFLWISPFLPALVFIWKMIFRLMLLSMLVGFAWLYFFVAG